MEGIIWEDIIKINLKEIRYEDGVASSRKHGDKPSSSVNG